MSSSRKAPLRVELVGAEPSDEALLASLLNMYAHELSAFYRVTFGADGQFIYRDLPSYFSDPARRAFLVQVDGAIGGFALVRRMHPDSTRAAWDVAEFFVSPEHRRNDVGTQAAHALWLRFPGTWQVRVLAANQPAVRFWEKAVAEFTGAVPLRSNADTDDEPWHTFHLESPGSAGNAG